MPTDPPFWSTLLFEQPLPLVVVAAVLGVGLTVGAARSRRVVLLGVAGACFGLAAGVFIIAALITTDRELLLEQTQRLVDLAAPLDAAGMAQLINAQATVRGGDGRVYLTAGDVLPELQLIDGRFGDLDHRITTIAAEARGRGEGVTQIDVRTQWRDRPLLTRWRLTWRKNAAGDFEVVRIEWLEHPLGVSPRNGFWKR